jgi:hypothetical protein
MKPNSLSDASRLKAINRLTIYYAETFCIIPLCGMLFRIILDIHPIWNVIQKLSGYPSYEGCYTELFKIILYIFLY